jgi:hypothetical protein
MAPTGFQRAAIARSNWGLTYRPAECQGVQGSIVSRPLSLCRIVYSYVPHRHAVAMAETICPRRWRRRRLPTDHNHRPAAAAYGSEHILDLMRDGISMRTIRRHRLDRPRITDEVRAMLVDAAKARQLKAWFRRPEEQRAQEKLATLIRLGQSFGTPLPLTLAMNLRRRGARPQRWSLILRR